MTPDLINAVLELIGGLFILFSVVKLYQDKSVKGISWVHVFFFSIWSVWNLFYYPALNQPLSFYGSFLLCVCQFIWLGQIIFYTRKEKS